MEVNKDGLKTHLECDEANISQYFPNEDIPEIISSLPDFVLEERQWQKKQKAKTIRFRVSEKEKIEIENRAREKGFKSTSKYLRHLALQ